MHHSSISYIAEPAVIFIKASPVTGPVQSIQNSSLCDKALGKAVFPSDRSPIESQLPVADKTLSTCRLVERAYVLIPYTFLGAKVAHQLSRLTASSSMISHT